MLSIFVPTLAILGGGLSSARSFAAFHLACIEIIIRQASHYVCFEQDRHAFLLCQKRLKPSQRSFSALTQQEQYIHSVQASMHLAHQVRYSLW